MNEDALIRATLAKAFTAYGLSHSAAWGMALFIDALVDERLQAALARRLGPLRHSVHGWALLSALEVEDEPLADAARRLRCNERVLRRHREQIRRLLDDGVRPPATIAA
jgi:hypothetical protein